jgi:DNA topoisomerase-1
MQKSLVIVESPAKAKTINQYLGQKYIVKSSIGHVRDLLSSTSKNKEKIKKSINKIKNIFLKSDEKNILIKKMGIDPYHNWKAKYYILPGKEKIISELKNIANKVDHIYLATDLDREGEAIAWHLKEVIGGDSSKFSRVVFNEITKRSIEKAFKNIGQINMNRVYAQQARRFMDRIVGYMISPLLWKKISRGLSAGRVQSVAVRIISERENIIKNFIPEEHWKVHVFLDHENTKEIMMDVTHYANKIFRPVSKQEVDCSIKKIKKSSCIVQKYEKKILYRTAPAPFITSTLQQFASLHLSFSVKKTMFLAQKLYEEGYITYMRTDSTYLSTHSIEIVREYIKNFYGSNYLPQEPNVYSNHKYSQEAHEAIRPCDIKIKDITSTNLNADAQKLYILIWNQFVASQMTSVKYQSITITVSADAFKLKKNKKIIIFNGWNKILQEENLVSEFPTLNIGSKLFINKIVCNQNFTKPIARFSEASLVRELEKKGIGRPSTYASITSKIQEKGYVKIKQNKFYAEKMGDILTVRLKKSFSNLIDYDFTARMEKQLDQVAENKINWKNVLDAFFEDFSKQLEIAKKSPEEGGMEPNIIVPTSIDCPVCYKKMGIKTAITGVFLSCLGYNTEPKKSCKKTINLISLRDFNKTEQNHKKNISLKFINQCKICNMAMDSYFINQNLKLHICVNNPSCIGYKLEEGFFNSPSYLSKVIQCEKCHHNMILKTGPFGKFFICINSMCKNTRKILPNGEISTPKLEPISFPELLCKKSNAWFVLREGVSGIFFAANTFPKSRETRSPLVEELVRFKHLLPEKIYYLSDAPLVDDQGLSLIHISEPTRL